MNQVKVMVIEDHKIIAADIAHLLTDWGYSVVGCAGTGEDALALFSEKKPDLALIDIQLPKGMDGIQVAEKINHLNPIPFVFLTAQADSKTVTRAKSTRPAAYLLKPFEERSLQISLELALENFSNRIHIENAPIIDNAETFANEIKLSAETILTHKDALYIKQNYRFVKLQKEDLMMVEASHNYSYIYTLEHRYIIRLPLSVILEKLNYDALIRIHRSFAISLLHIKEFSNDEIITNNGKTVTITPAYREHFLKNFSVL